MADRDELLAQLSELDQKELGEEHARLVARSHEIRATAARGVVRLNEGNEEPADIAREMVNLAEEAAQHAVRLAEIRREQT